MRVKSRKLPEGWYPLDGPSACRQIESWPKRPGERLRRAAAGVVPHAGWDYSGPVAHAVIEELSTELQTLVVVGGHLPPGSGVLASMEEGYETPMGVIEADLGLLEELRSRLELRPDTHADNTVEVQLPLIRYRLPRCRVLALRVEPTHRAIALGEALAEAATRLGRRIGVLGSTDLTHYGSHYGFSPRGTGRQAVDWVKRTNDRRLIEELLRLEPREALERAARDRSACSAGGAAAAVEFARRIGHTRAELLGYRTSYDTRPAESFVGYAGIIYSKP